MMCKHCNHHIEKDKNNTYHEYVHYIEAVKFNLAEFQGAAPAEFIPIYTVKCQKINCSCYKPEPTDAVPQPINNLPVQ